ncbi:MAG: glycosyltransferase [Candidatus Omnitrophica bacterium]|nr:glycosyltransferase [Candidatus Omnitrophota bacterium]
MQDLLDSCYSDYRDRRAGHWDAVASHMDHMFQGGRYYHKRLEEIYRFLVPRGQKVLEIGCGNGELLASLEPSKGVGIDFSSQMIERAKRRYPRLTFFLMDAHELAIDDTFDVIILSDIVDDLYDVLTVLRQLKKVSNPRTRIIINSYSRLWELPLKLARLLKLSRPTLTQNWLTVEDIRNLLFLADIEVVHKTEEILVPVHIPFAAAFFNRFLVKIWPFNNLALTNFIIARPVSRVSIQTDQPMVSVIVPARNEAGNIPNIIARVPEMGSGTELVFVEGFSSDDTYEEIEKAISAHPERRCKLLKQPGKGKGDAVRAGFAASSGDVLMILDADLTVAPEDLKRFYEVLILNKAEFVNGVRLVYPMEERSMYFFNLLGNKFFSIVFSWIIGQPTKDTLCGTKVLWRSEYESIVANRAYFGDFDPFGDFDLLLGAAKLNLKIVELPVRYRKRVYGMTNIQRWKHGLLLLRMSIFAAKRIKFI